MRFNIAMRLIMAEMSESEINTAIEDFIKLNAEHRNRVERPSVKQINKTYYLLLAEDTTYDQFCYWVNYIVYFVAENDICYKQEFAYNAPLIKQRDLGRHLPPPAYDQLKDR